MTIAHRKQSLICCFMVIAFTLSGCTTVADKLLLYPSTHVISVERSSREKITFKRGVIEVVKARSPRVARDKVKVYVLSFFGNGDRPERWISAQAHLWEDHNVEVWGVNYPGFGSSSGPATLSSVCPAADEVFNRLKDRALGKPIVVFGSSIGAATALHLAANHSFAGIIANNPPPIRDVVIRRYGWWNLWILAGLTAKGIPDDLDSIRNAKNAKVRAYFLISDHDLLIPLPFYQRVLDAYCQEKRVVILKGSHHNSKVAGPNFVSAMDWLIGTH